MRIVIGTAMLILVLPKVAYQCLVAWYHHKKVALYVREVAGKGMERIQHRTVTVANTPLNDIDTWFLYLKGKYDLIGPQPLDFDIAHKLDARNRTRILIAPGIISPHKVKQRSGIAHQSESQVAINFATNSTLLRRFQVFVIWCVQHIFSATPSNLLRPASFNLMGVSLANVSMTDAVQRVILSLMREPVPGNAAKFAFVNADCANKYSQDPVYKRTLNSFENVFADGIGVKIAARWQGVSVVENVNGTDMFPFLCAELVKEQKSVYLLGASKKVIDKMVANLRIAYPQLNLAGYSDGFTNQDDPTKLCNLINKSGAQLLLVAMGAPRQERWIDDNAPLLNVNAVIGVGGLFDFYSEEVSRAPVWLRELSLEWVWRLGAQPMDKGKRYLVGNPLFLFRAMIASRQKNDPTLASVDSLI